MTLQFKVAGQHIVWVNNTEYVVADSRNYLKAVFDLPEEWTYPVTVLFKGGCKVVPCLLAKPGEAITVPAEVIKPRVMLVSCYCGDLMTTDSARVEIRPSGYVDSASPSEPEAPSYYSQMVAYIGQINALIGDDAEAHDVLTKLQGVIDKAQAATTLPDQTVTGQMDALIDQYIANEEAVANQLIDGTIEFIDSAAETVRNNAFTGCSDLRTVILRNAKELKPGAFRESKSVYEVDARNVYKVGSNAFYYCENIRKINLSSAVVFSGFSIFDSCRQMTKIDLPKLEELGSSTFAGCFNLETVIIRTPKLCAAQNATSFNGSKIKPNSGSATGYVYVPRGLVEEYKSATNWTIIADRIRAIEDYPDICAPEEWED